MLADLATSGTASVKSWALSLSLLDLKMLGTAKKVILTKGENASH